MLEIELDLPKDKQIRKGATWTGHLNCYTPVARCFLPPTLVEKYFIISMVTSRVSNEIDGMQTPKVTEL